MSVFVFSSYYAHIRDLRHPKRVVQSCPARAFTFSIKFLWRVTYEGADFRNEMVGDLLELAASNKCCGDFRWLSGDAVGKRKKAEEMSEKEKLNVEVQSAGLQYRDPPTPKDGNCMFHATSDQLACLDLTLKTPSELHSSVIQYPQNSPLTSDGTHLREFISY